MIEQQSVDDAEILEFERQQKNDLARKDLEKLQLRFSLEIYNLTKVIIFVVFFSLLPK